MWREFRHVGSRLVVKDRNFTENWKQQEISANLTVWCHISSQYFEVPLHTTHYSTSRSSDLKMEKICLEVRGREFRTKLSTLLTAHSPEDENHYFCTLRKWESLTNVEHRPILLERNGERFRYILEYLRHGNASILPGSLRELKELRTEADFYRLGGLMKRIFEIEMWHDLIERLESFQNAFLSGLSAITIDARKYRRTYMCKLEKKIEASCSELRIIIHRLTLDPTNVQEFTAEFSKFFIDLDDALLAVLYEAEAVERFLPRSQIDSHLECLEELSEARKDAVILINQHFRHIPECLSERWTCHSKWLFHRKTEALFINKAL